ncbi:hypothetical protein ACE6H2_024278 [Prunus campanulata]
MKFPSEGHVHRNFKEPANKTRALDILLLLLTSSYTFTGCLLHHQKKKQIISSSPEVSHGNPMPSFSSFLFYSLN